MLECGKQEDGVAGCRTGLIILSLACSLGIWAQESPRIALVLSGGGARGSAHIGVLKALEEMRIPVHMVTGTSMGAIVGAAYASGLSPQEIEQALAQTDWRDIFDDRPPRKDLAYRRKVDDQTYLTRFELGFNHGKFQSPSGLVQGQKLSFVLQSLLIRAVGTEDFHQLAIPFCAVATDIERGEKVVLDHGDLARAVRASMSIPGVFAPIQINGFLLVDGGLVENLPVQEALDMGADIVIAVDVGEPLFEQNQLNSISRITNQMIGMQIRTNVQKSLSMANVIIRPELQGFGSSEFERGPEMVPLGIEAALKMRADLSRLSVPAGEYQAHLEKIRRPHPQLNTFRSVQIVQSAEDQADHLFQHVNIRPGDAFDLERIRTNLQHLYELGDYQRVDFSLNREGDDCDLLLEAQEKDWGPNYLRFGTNLFADFAGDSSFDFLASYNMTQLNRLRAELKLTAQLGESPSLQAEFYQPLSRAETWFAAVSVLSQTADGYFEQSAGLFAPYRIDTGSAVLSLGYQFDRFGAIRIGPAFTRSTLEPQTGPNQGESFDVDVAGLSAVLVWDQFDNMNFPRHGSFVALNYFDANEAWGSESEYKRLVGFLGLATTHGRHTLLSLSNYFSALDTEGPEAQNLGGLFRLSGYQRDSINGRYGASSAVVYLYRIAQLPTAFGDGIYVGGSLEAGNLWSNSQVADWGDLKTSLSLVIGIDTVMGPVYFATGFSEEYDNEVYLYVGRTF